MIVRPSRKDDLLRITDLIRASFKPAILPYMIYSQHGAAHFLEVVLDFPDVHRDRKLLTAADSTGEVLGFADFRVVAGNESFLSYICVAERARGHGVARQLIETFLFDNPEVATMRLDVFADNEPALRLYDQLGFVPMATRHWEVRPLPAIHRNRIEALSFANLPMAVAAFERYGFCEIEARLSGVPIRFGRIGPDVLRCFDPETYGSDDLLGLLRSQFAARDALFITSDPFNGDHVINSSIGMSWAINAQ